MQKKAERLIGLFMVLLVLGGCATFRSDVAGHSGLEPQKTRGAEPVDVLFVARHLEQTRGLDAIPKLQNKYQIMNGFDDILLDATHEFSNLQHYALYTEFASDMSDPQRIALKDSLMNTYAHRIVMEFRQEKSFAKYFLGTLGSVVSLTLIPVPYTREFTLTVDVFDTQGRLKKSYQRRASTTKWIEACLFPIYPFHTEKRNTEELYVAFLHDVFRQIEAENSLSEDL